MCFLCCNSILCLQPSFLIWHDSSRAAKWKVMVSRLAPFTTTPLKGYGGSKYVYVCLSIFLTFANFSLRTKHLSAKLPINYRAHESRPDTLVQVSARSVHSGVRGRRSLCFFSAWVDKTISPVSIREALFRTYIPLKCRHFFGPSCTYS